MPQENTSPNASLALIALGRTTGQRQLAELEQAGLGLTQTEIQQLEQARREALATTGRLEFGNPAIVQIARTFSASSYLFEGSCAETLENIQESFYRLRSDAPSDIPDDELIEGLFAAFEGSCGGDCDALAALSATEVLEAWCPDYKGLLINLYEPIYDACHEKRIIPQRGYPPHPTREQG